MWKPKKKNGFADRGKWAEAEVQKFLASWGEGIATREWNRLLDTRAARVTIAAAKADFDFYCDGAFGLLEVKETEHEYRIARPKVPQLPNLRKRELCGGLGLLLVYHSTIDAWRMATAEWLSDSGDKGSWNLSEKPQFPGPAEALSHYYPHIF